MILVFSAILVNTNRSWYRGSIPDCHSGDPGSIPGDRDLLCCSEKFAGVTDNKQNPQLMGAFLCRDDPAVTRNDAHTYGNSKLSQQVPTTNIQELLSFQSDVLALIVSFLAHVDKQARIAMSNKSADRNVFNLSYCCKEFHFSIHYSDGMNEFWKNRLLHYFSFSRWNRSLLYQKENDAYLAQMVDDYTQEASGYRYLSQAEKERVGLMPPLSFFFQYQIEQLKAIRELSQKKNVRFISLTGYHLSDELEVIDFLVRHVADKPKRSHERISLTNLEYEKCHPLAQKLFTLCTRITQIWVDNKPIVIVRMERSVVGYYKYRGLSFYGYVYCDREIEPSEEPDSTSSDSQIALQEGHFKSSGIASTERRVIYWMKTEAGKMLTTRADSLFQAPLWRAADEEHTKRRLKVKKRIIGIHDYNHKDTLSDWLNGSIKDIYWR